MTNERMSMMSEINELESLIAMTPEEYIIDKKSLESRLRKVRRELDKLPAESQSQKAQLTFRGDPVEGTRGILVDFAGSAMRNFGKIFAAVAAYLKGGELKGMGQIPGAHINQLLITGVATGSFGFEFELPREQASLFPENFPSQVMDKIERLFSQSVFGGDDEVAEIVNDISPVVIGSFRTFLNVLRTKQAYCAIERDGGGFRFENYEQIKKKSFERLAKKISQKKKKLMQESSEVSSQKRESLSSTYHRRIRCCTAK